MRTPPRLEAELSALAEAGMLRALHLPAPGQVDFCSNDYLGLAREAETATAAAGSGGSRLLAGHHALHAEAEAWCAAFFQAEAALLFNSGYMANLGVLGSLPTRHDTVLYDAQVHASIKEGMRLSPATRHPFGHNDLAALESRLRKAQGDCYVVTESLFSMDGDFAPLREMAALCAQYGAYLIVDEAHSTGICGANGAGSCAALGITDAVFLRIHTFGKAVGRHGAAVLGSRSLVQWLVNRSRAFIYTTALPPAAIQSLTHALHRLPDLHAERARLLTLRSTLQQAFAHEGLHPGGDPASPIVPLILPGNAVARAAAHAAQTAGFDVRAILSPTVPAGTERLRIVLHSYNTPDEIQGLALALRSAMP